MNHKTRKPFTVLTTVALTASLLLGTGATAFAEENAVSTTAVKLTFPDIVPTHWAKSHVAKLAAAGIVKGYTDGGFRPSQNVTQQEAIVMVIRMVGLEDEALAGTDDVVTGFQEDPFFTKYVVKALEERIIDMNEETAAAATGDTPWGKRPATREWVSKLIIRALGEQPGDGTLGFADASEVSASAAGYVAKSQELELVTGFTDNTFKPKDAVTRAQIATILSRADQYIADDAAKYESGFVTSADGSTLVMQTSGGAARTFGLNAETLVFDAEGGSLDLNALTNLTPIRVIHQGGQAYYIEVTGGAVELETIDGELAALDITDSSLVLRGEDGSLMPYELSPTATVTNLQGEGLSMSQLTEGSDIRLQRAVGGTEVSAIVLIEEAYNAEGTGTVQSANADAGSLTFTNEEGKVVTYSLAEDAVLSVKGQPIADLTSLQTGDTVAYEIKDSLIVSVDVTAQKFVTKVGDFQGFAGDTITIKVNSTTPEAFIVKPNVDVVIEGLTDPEVADLQAGDAVQLRLNGSTSQVEQITVTNRNVSKFQSVTVINFQADDFLTVRDEKGKAHLFYITDRSQFVLDGTAMTEQQLPLYVAAGRKVTLNVTADQLVRLDVVTKVTGTVTAINSASRNITVKTADNATVTVPYASFVAVEVPLQSSAGFADVTVGAKVHMSMGVNTDAVSSIQVEKSFVYTVTSATVSPRTVYAKDGKGNAVSLSLDSEAKVLNRDGQTIVPTSLPAGQPIVVNYAGRKIVSVQEASIILGKVTALDTTAGKLSVTDYNGNVKNYSLTAGLTVQEGTTVSTSASALQLNDRAALVVDAQGKPYVFVAIAENRKFSAYDASKNEITLKIAKLGDQSKYTLETNPKLQSADGATLTMNQFKENDAVTIYVLNGKVVELVKQ